MTVHSKLNPIGIDKNILKFQNKINAIGWTNIDVYGRLYIEEVNGQKIAKSHVGNGEYKEVFNDDQKTAVFGFFIGENRTGLNMIKVPVELVCSCNLDSIYTTSERNDEEALLEVLKIVKKLTLLDHEREIKTGFENVFSRISTERLKWRDGHPWFTFSILFDIVYKNEI